MKNYIKWQEDKRNMLIKKCLSGNHTFNNPVVELDPFNVAPLTAVVLFKDRICERYSVMVNEIEYEIISEESNNWISIIGLLPGTSNIIKIKGRSKGKIILEHETVIDTDFLPKDFSNIKINVLNIEEKSRDFIALNLAKTKGRVPNENICSIVDSTGIIKWYYTQRGWNLFKQLKNNNIIIDAPTKIEGIQRYIPTGFIEMSLLGEVINYYEVPNGLHHDVNEMDNGNFLVLTNDDNSVEDVVLEINRQTKEVVDKYDFKNVLDVNRQPGLDKEVVNHPLDWLHLNSVFYDNSDDSIIVSARNQNIVVKISRGNKEIKWILGNHENWGNDFKKYLLEPVGDDFEWSWAQHSAFMVSKDRLLLFDNGNFRSYDLKNAKLAYENYSRGVEYRINENSMTVEQVWQYGKERGNELKCPYLGSIALQSNGNRLICFGGIIKDKFGNPIDDLSISGSKASAHIIEVGAENIFELVIRDEDRRTENGFVCYRAERVNLFSS